MCLAASPSPSPLAVRVGKGEEDPQGHCSSHAETRAGAVPQTWTRTWLSGESRKKQHPSPLRAPG